VLYEPVIIGNVVYLVEGGNSVVARNVGDGKIRWSHTFNNTIAPGQMLLYATGGSLYFMSFRLGLASAPIHPEQVVLYELNPANGTIKAAHKPPRTGWDSPTVVDHTLYYLVGSNLYAEQLPTEKLLWHVPISSPTGSQLQEMFIQNGVVYIKVYVTDSQSPSYTLIDAFDARTGKMLWRSSQIPEEVRTWAIAETMIYAASYSGRIYAIDAHHANLVWKQSFDFSAMLATSDVLYLSYNIHGTGNHGFMALRAKDGAKLWQQSFSGLNDFSQLTLFNGVLYGLNELDGGKVAGSYVLYAFDAQNGSLSWKTPIDASLVEIA
jgi:outer membrane protein assembly factor BamB